MAVFVAVVAVDGRAPDPELQRRLADGVAFLGAPQTAASPDGVLTVAFAGRGTGFASADEVSVAASGRLDDRARLEAALDLGPGFATPDMLLAAYRRWGAAMLEHIIGDFAFVLWDAREKRLLAATDQFGTRPIHYGSATPWLILSTAIGPIRDSGLVDTGLDETFIADFIAVGVPLDVAVTVHRGIRRLPPAHRFGWTGGAPRIERYWRIPEPTAPLRLSTRADYVETFRSAFFAAVADRLPAEGPISLALSGGMDSPSIAAAVCAILGAEATAARVQAHTIVYRDFPEEEGRFAQLVVERLGISATTWTAEDFLLGATHVKWRVGPQPDALRELAPESAIVEGAAASGATRFSGLGGDVLLWPSPVTPWGAVSSGAWTPPALVHHLRLFGELPSAGMRPLARRWLRPPPPRPIPPWLRPDLVTRTGLDARLAVLTADRRQGPRAFESPHWARLAAAGDPGNSGLDVQITRPFMDVRLIEFVTRLPAPLLRQKRVLREAMRPWLPAEIVARPKTPLGQASAYIRAQPQVVARGLQLIDLAPELERYVDVPALRAAATRWTARDSGAVRRCEALAMWMRNR